MANKVNEGELNARYTAACHRFASASDWREYIQLADEFRALDTYKDSAQKYSQCVKGASAPAYREVQAHLASLEDRTIADYREAARIMLLIQDYRDAREMARVYTVKANAMTYDEAITLVTNSLATTEEIGRAVEMFKTIKGFRNTRELIERYEKYYCERMYEEGMALMHSGHVWSEFDEAADIFEKISTYGDAAEQAATCRRKANKMRPARRKQTSPERVTSGTDEAVRVTTTGKGRKGRHATADAETDGDSSDQKIVKPQRSKKPADETVNNLAEVWRTLDKRRLAMCIFWFLMVGAALFASIRIGYAVEEDPEGWVACHVRELRMGVTLVALVSCVLCAREFLWMLTASMRRKLAQAAATFARRLASPVIKAITKLLASIGIDLTRRNRLNGRDEKTFVYEEETKAKKTRKKMRNDMKWAEQPDNAARVRFIFIDYMIARIRGGYFLRRTMTPDEISRDLILEEDEKDLFAAYQIARYAPNSDANQDISDAMVGRFRAINVRKK